MTICDELRQAVLQAAIQGKLTEQREEDGTAEELLDEIRKEKEKLIAEGKIKKEKKLPEIDEVPFDIPENWKWCRLHDIVSLLGDGIHGTPEYDENGEWYFVNGKNLSNGSIIIKDNTKRVNRLEYEKYKKELSESTVLVSINGTIGNIAFYNNEPIMLGKSACYFNLLRSEMKSYSFWLLKSDYFIKYANDKATGSTIKNVSLQAMNNFKYPLPPLAEQHRIVERVNKLMKKIDALQTIEDELQSMKQAFPGNMRDAILQAAMQGRLTEQFESDGTAEELLEEIRKEKEKLIKEGKIKKEKTLPEISEDEIPFDIPENWKWVRIPETVWFQEGPGILAADFRIQGVPLIRIAGIQGDEVTLEGCNYLDEEMVSNRWSHFRLDIDDIVISSSASMDKIARVTEIAKGAIPYTGIIRFKMEKAIDSRFFTHFLRSPFYREQVENMKTGGMIKHYGPTHLRKMIIPLPPLAEQHRIVARLNELLPLCDTLEEAK